jgi:branched-subunit amino acid aminotransferase/4-amino-4-deoxychorismate lyase
MRETEKIWMNGELVDWNDARIHVGAHGLHYGSGVFEGIRAYETPKGSAVFRLGDHLTRLDNSARLLHMELPYSIENLRAACHELIGVNGLPECYLRPIAFFGYGELGVSAVGNPVDVVIMSWPWGAYLGDEGMKNGISAKISSWQRIGPNVIPHVAKATGIYLNSMLAVTEANRAGYDEAILLTAEGFIADGSGENVFIVKDGELYTPDPRHRDPDRAGPRLPGAREVADPLRPLPRRRGVHDRHRGRGHAAAQRGRRRDRGRADHARDPGGLPGHRARPQRALGSVARLRHARACGSLTNPKNAVAFSG